MKCCWQWRYNPSLIHVLAKGKHALLLIRHPPCYSWKFERQEQVQIRFKRRRMYITVHLWMQRWNRKVEKHIMSIVIWWNWWMLANINTILPHCCLIHCNITGTCLIRGFSFKHSAEITNKAIIRICFKINR